MPPIDEEVDEEDEDEQHVSDNENDFQNNIKNDNLPLELGIFDESTGNFIGADLDLLSKKGKRKTSVKKSIIKGTMQY